MVKAFSCCVLAMAVRASIECKRERGGGVGDESPRLVSACLGKLIEIL